MYVMNLIHAMSLQHFFLSLINISQPFWMTFSQTDDHASKFSIKNLARQHSMKSRDNSMKCHQHIWDPRHIHINFNGFVVQLSSQPLSKVVPLPFLLWSRLHQDWYSSKNHKYHIFNVFENIWLKFYYCLPWMWYQFNSLSNLK